MRSEGAVTVQSTGGGLNYQRVGQAVPADRDGDRQIQQHFPGLCTASGRIHGRNAADSARSKPRPVVADSNTAPAWETTRIAVVSTFSDGV